MGSIVFPDLWTIDSEVRVMSSADPSASTSSDASNAQSWNGRAGQWETVNYDELESCPFDETEPVAREPETPKPEIALQRRQYLEQHIRSNPTDINAFLELARIYRAERKPIEAKRVLNQAIRIFPKDETLLWELEEATLARSLQQLREVGDLASRLDTAETDRELQRCQKDWAHRRIEICRARLKRDPSRLNLRIALGEALHDADLHEESINELRLIDDLDDHSPAAFLIRGRCLLAMKKELEAMVAFRAASIRRCVNAPLMTKVLALRSLCETAERLGISLTLQKYQQHLQAAETEMAKQRNGAPPHHAG